jgi:DNA-binding CsgD family transcriptional regulator
MADSERETRDEFVARVKANMERAKLRSYEHKKSATAAIRKKTAEVTQRERDVVLLRASGMSVHDTALGLDTTDNNVWQAQYTARNKLGFETYEELFKFANEHWVKR